MTQEKDYLDLADRVEAATGPDRDIDAAIAPFAGLSIVDEGHPLGRCCYDQNHRLVVLPSYTRSLDAAMTLVPEGCCDWLFRHFEDGTFACDLEIVGEQVESIAASGASIPLALTAAALRAHASRVGDRRGE